MKKILLYLVLGLTLLSCNEDGGKKYFMPTVTGNSFEVMVVSTPEVWKSDAGFALKDVLGGDMHGLPQPEPYFNVSHCPTSKFTELFKPMRNIVIVNVDSTVYTQPKISFGKERWARTQALVYINSPDVYNVPNLVYENKDRIIRFFSDAEAERMVELHKRSRNREGSQLVKDMFGVDLVVPITLDKSKVGEDFIWFSNCKYDEIQNMVIYKFPYKDTSDFSLKNLVRRRDSVMKVNVPGAKPDSYVATEMDDTYGRAPKAYTLNVNGRYTVEVRGFWYMENMVMAGPFVSRACLSADHKDIIVTECFLFAPNRKKRNLLRSLESAVGSLKVLEDSSVVKKDTLK